MYIYIFLIFLSVASCQDIRFMVVGDWGAEWVSFQTEVAAAMDQFAAEYGPTFIISTGDNFYQDGVESPTDPQFNEKWRWVYNTTNLINIPWYITIGNHDYRNGDGREWHQVTFGQTEPKWIFPHLWHSFTQRAGDVTARFVLFDTEAIRLETNNHTTMLTWMEEELAKPATVKLPFAHREIYATGDKGPVNGRNWDNVQPILARNNVKFYICGHDHNLQHLHHTDRSTNNIDYIISGGGGAFPYLQDEDKQDVLEEMGVTVASFVEDNGFVGVIINQQSTRFLFYDIDYRLQYEYTRNHDE